MDPGHALVARGGIPLGDAPPPYDFTWAFVVQIDPQGRTRLVVRERYRYLQRWAPIVVEPTQIFSFIMSWQMLRGIRARAER